MKKTSASHNLKNQSNVSRSEVKRVPTMLIQELDEFELTFHNNKDQGSQSPHELQLPSSPTRAADFTESI